LKKRKAPEELVCVCSRKYEGMRVGDKLGCVDKEKTRKERFGKRQR